MRAATASGASEASITTQRSAASSARARNPARSFCWNSRPNSSNRSSPEPAGQPAFQRRGRVHVEDQRQVRLHPDGRVVDRVDQPAQIAPRGALVDAGGIREPVGDDVAARGERRADRAFQVIAPRGGEQQDLGLRRPARRIALHQQAADVLGPGRAARLAGQDRVAAPARASPRPGGAPAWTCRSRRCLRD
jgi:hypothetical protein